MPGESELHPSTQGSPRLAAPAAGGSAVVRRPLADSPWFWAYVFATGALISLILAQPRYSQRQPQIERQFAGRQVSGQVIMGRDGPIPLSDAERLVLPLKPLYVVAAAAMAVAWGGLCWQRFTHREPPVRGGD